MDFVQLKLLGVTDCISFFQSKSATQVSCLIALKNYVCLQGRIEDFLWGGQGRRRVAPIKNFFKMSLK